MTSLADILSAHQWAIEPGSTYCSCGKNLGDNIIGDEPMAQHQAEVVAGAGYPTQLPLQNMHRDIAVVCSDKLTRIRQLVVREPSTSLAARIRAILDEPPAALAAEGVKEEK